MMTQSVEKTGRGPMWFAGLGLCGLGFVCVFLYLTLYVIEFGNPLINPPWDLFSGPQAIDTLISFSEVTVGVLGIAITVVAIIVELAANRYTPRITELFLRDPVNGFVLGSFVVTAVLVVWIDMSLHGAHYPTTMAWAATFLMSMSLLTILPYFVYVFDFLSPTRVVQRIRQTATRSLTSLTKKKISVERAREDVIRAIEQLGDVALNSVDKKDKPIAIDCLAALSQIALAHIEKKDQLPDAWFDSTPLVSHDQDFVALHPDMVRALTDRKTWLEMKVLRQYQALFTASAHHLHDVNHMVGIQTRRIGLFSMEANDEASLRLSQRFLNTYMRTAINRRDIRSAYNLLNEYRLLGVSALQHGRESHALALAEKLKFYGQLAFQSGLAFVLEIVAYDLCTLIEHAHATGASCHAPLLEFFLDLDREPEGKKGQEASLRGVRKAQIKLATYYLVHGEEAFAHQIHDDMKNEQEERLRSIHRELLDVQEAEYWEVVDRGINFDYLPEDRRAVLDVYFKWFDESGTDSSAPA